jgi:hypothetical protein
MSDILPRFKGLSAMGFYAEVGIRLAEESLAEMKRHNAEVERLLRLLTTQQVQLVTSVTP